MENTERQNQIELSKILGLISDNYSTIEKPASWPEIYVEIGKLIGKARKDIEPVPLPKHDLSSPIGDNWKLSPYHYHGDLKCFNNPCTGY